MPHRILLAALAFSALTAGSAEAQALKTFQDWILGCDNLRACVALGLEPSGNASGVHLRIARPGDADAEPDIRIVAYDERPGPLRLRLTFDAADLLSLPDLPATRRGDRGTLEGHLPRAVVRAFVEAARTAKTLSVSVVGGTDAKDATVVSMAGAAASLLAMDELQRRVGTATALIATGPQPAARVPPIPAVPVIRAARPAAATPPAAMPKPVAAAVRAADCDEPPETRPIRAQLDDRTLLWGVLCTKGAYREIYAFFTWRPGAPAAEPVPFPFPGVGTRGEPDNTLVNPGFDHRAGIMTFGDIGRSLGDCGAAGRFLWDGTRFQPLDFKIMPDCRGVSSDDWLVTWRARPEKP